MTRLLAILLLSSVNFYSLTPAFGGEAELQLPACCRASGKHKCMMKRALRIEQSSNAGRSIATIDGRCPFSPQSGTPAISSQSAQPVPLRVSIDPLQSYPAALAQTEAHFRISFSRVRQKRGPPSLTS